MGTGIDNIEVDPNNGDLWIGCHPLTWKIIDHLKVILNYVGPSQVTVIGLLAQFDILSC